MPLVYSCISTGLDDGESTALAVAVAVASRHVAKWSWRLPAATEPQGETRNCYCELAELEARSSEWKPHRTRTPDSDSVSDSDSSFSFQIPSPSEQRAFLFFLTSPNHTPSSALFIYYILQNETAPAQKSKKQKTTDRTNQNNQQPHAHRPFSNCKHFSSLNYKTATKQTCARADTERRMFLGGNALLMM
jgi:hypothetical protein